MKCCFIFLFSFIQILNCFKFFGPTSQEIEDVPFRFEKPDVIEPLILTHGVSACQLEAKLHHAEEPLFYCFHNEEWTLLWINIIDIVPYLTGPCFVHNLQTHYNETSKTLYNNEGVEIRVPKFGSTEGVEYLTRGVLKEEGKYMSTLVDYFVQAGYEREKSIRAALVDWRLTPQQWFENGSFEKIKNLVEETYEMNNQTKVHLLGHSMGGPTFSTFLSHYVNQEWKDKYIKSFFSIGGAYDGGYEALGDQIYGHYSPLPVDITKLSTGLGGLHWQTPFYTYPNDIVIYTPEKNYTLSEYKEIYAAVGHADHGDLFEYVHQIDSRIAPNVTTHCIQGIGRKTPKAFYFEKLKMGEKYETVEWDDNGDNTVFFKSSGVCNNWANDPDQSYPVTVSQFKGEKFKEDYHRFLVNDPDILETVFQLIYGKQKLRD